MIWVQALFLGWIDLLRPRNLRLVGLGIALTLVILIAVQALVVWLLARFGPESVTLPFLGVVSLGNSLSWGALALFPVMAFFLMAPVAAGFAGLFTGQVADQVEAVHYPNRRGKDPDFWDGLMDGVQVMGAALGVAALTIMATPFIGPLAPLAFYAANGWLLGREFLQMAARRHVDQDTARSFRQAHRFEAISLGVAIAFLLSIPVLNIAAPILSAAAFTHLFQRIAW